MGPYRRRKVNPSTVTVSTAATVVGVGGAIAVWAAGAFGPILHGVGYAALALGWALMLTAIFLRTRYHRQRMREDV